MDGDGVLIIEDHRLLAQAVATALADHGIRAQGVDPGDLDAAVASVPAGTLVLLDLRLGEGRDGGRAIRPLVDRGARVVVVTGTTDALALGRALDAGAVTVVDKHQPFTELVETVLAIRAGTLPSTDARRQEILRAAAERRADQEAAGAVLDRLSGRESEVLEQLCQGRSAQEIAAAAGVSLTTVRAQIRSVLTKLGARSQLQAVARAHELRRRAAGRRSRQRTGRRRGGRAEAGR